MQTSAWASLARYATRRAAGAVRLTDIPADVLAYLWNEYLAPDDALNLLAALLGGRHPRVDVPSDVAAVPLELRARWLGYVLYAELAAQLRGAPHVIV